jgi:hypothetical protein
MFNRRLHPTPSGFAFGLAVIALWALIWIWFFAQLSRPRPPAGGNAVAAAQSMRHARVLRGDAPLAFRGGSDSRA